MQTAGHALKRNRSGFWEVRYSEKQPDGTWRSRTVSTRTKDRGEASEFKAALVTNEARLVQQVAVPVLGTVLEAYVKAVPGQDFNLRAPRRHLADLPVDLLTPEQVQDYTRVRTVDEGVVGSTVLRELGAVTAALNWAVSKRTFGLRADDVPAIDKPPRGNPRNLWLNEEEEPWFYACAMGLSLGQRRLHRLTRFVALGLDTAARREALMELTWDRVDFRAGKIDFRVPGAATGNKRRTVVEVSDRLMPLLERAHREWRADGAHAGEPVVGVGSLRTSWESWVAGAEGGRWKWMTPHLMRHSWAKLNARAGVSLFDVAGVLGDTYETVARNYLHDCPVNMGIVNRRFLGQ